MREYYIRREGDEDSSGPFDIDQISSLMEAGKLDPSAYFYDIESESWAPIANNEELMDTLFPKRRKLSLRTPEVEAERKRLEAEAAETAEAAAKAAQEATDNPENDPEATPSETKHPAKEKPAKLKKEPVPEVREKLEVTRMLALAEGRDEDTDGLTPRERRASIALFGLRFLAICFGFSIFAMLYIEKDLVMTANAIAMAKSPYVLLAVFDLLMFVFLLLQVTSIYPLLRFRAAVGAGLLTMLFASSGDSLLLVGNLLLMAAIYFCSAMMKLSVLVASVVAGLAGILLYVYVLLPS